MKKGLFLMLLMVVVGFSVSASGATSVNKVKKVKYLGLKYYGQVNKAKVPEGIGTLSHGYEVKGTFMGTEVTDASIDAGRMTYQGDLSYDENNLTLKAGGIVTVRYFINDGQNHTWKNAIKDTYGHASYSYELERDTIVNMRWFESDTQHIPFSYQLKINKELDPPTTVDMTLVAKLEKHEYDISINYASVKRFKHVYVVNTDGSFNVDGYQDKKNRKWAYSFNEKERCRRYKVTYPDGSYYAENSAGNDYRDIQVNWKVVLPNEVTVEDIEYWGGGSKQLIHMKNKTVLVSGLNIDAFIQINESKAIPQREKVEVLFTDRDMSSLSDEQVEKIIKEEIIPVFGAKNVGVLSNYDINPYLNYSEYGIGYFTDGHYMSKVTKNEKEAAAEKARVAAIRPALNKEYGKVYVDAMAKLKLMAGMPIELLADSRLFYVNGYTTNVYRVAENSEGVTTQFKVEFFPQGGQYKVWTKNGKITNFRTWTSGDETEWKRRRGIW